MREFHFILDKIPYSKIHYRREKDFILQIMSLGAEAGDLLNRQTFLIVRMLQPKCECRNRAAEENRFSFENSTRSWNEHENTKIVKSEFPTDFVVYVLDYMLGRLYMLPPSRWI